MAAQRHVEPAAGRALRPTGCRPQAPDAPAIPRLRGAKGAAGGR